MTLNDIGRMMQLAKVPRSKTVECMYPNPHMTIYVPAAQFLVICEVVSRIKLLGQTIDVCILDSRVGDVREREHVYVKVKGETSPPGKPYDDAFMPEAFFRRHRIRTARMRNAEVVIESASVVAL